MRPCAFSPLQKTAPPMVCAGMRRRMRARMRRTAAKNQKEFDQILTKSLLNPYQILTRWYQPLPNPYHILTKSCEILPHPYQIFTEFLAKPLPNLTKSCQIFTKSYQILPSHYQILTRSDQILTKSLPNLKPYQILTKSYQILPKSLPNPYQTLPNL